MNLLGGHFTSASLAQAISSGESLGGGGGISFDGSTANGVLTYKDSDEATVESNFTIDGTKLSGSAASTGSFGTVYTSIIESNPANNIKFKEAGTTNFLGMDPANNSFYAGGNLYLSANSGNNALILSAGSNSRPMLSANSGGGIEFSGFISGSSTSTGSFGQVYTTWIDSPSVTMFKKYIRINPPSGTSAGISMVGSGGGDYYLSYYNYQGGDTYIDLKTASSGTGRPYIKLANASYDGLTMTLGNGANAWNWQFLSGSNSHFNTNTRKIMEVLCNVGDGNRFRSGRDLLFYGDVAFMNSAGGYGFTIEDGTNTISGSATSTGSFGSIHTADKIGIGTTSPSSELELTRGDSTATLVKIGNTSTGAAGIYIDASNGDYDGSDYVTMVQDNSLGFAITTTANAGNITFNSKGVATLGLDAGHAVFEKGIKVKGCITGSGQVSDASGDGMFISGSQYSSASFGRVEATSISASLYQGQIGSRYVHSQTSDSATWTINHNIGHKYPVVTVYDTDDAMMLPETGTATDSDTFTLTFNEAITGKAVVSVGGIGENAGANYIFTQGSSTTNWRVTHSLSQQYPNITVFDENNQVIIPETVTATSDNNTDIVFSSGQSGYANFSIGSGIPNISSENAGKVLKVRSGGQGVEWSPTSSDVSGSMSISGSILPTSDNNHNLGSNELRWANLYTGDIELSNEGTEGNEVDGTTGSWTIQEGEDDLYLLNRKNGKKYRFKLEEIT